MKERKPRSERYRYIYDTNQHNPITFYQKEIISFIFSVLLLSVERLVG